MSKFFLTAILITAFVTSNAQEIKYYTVRPGENIFDKVPAEEIYAYDQFEQGIVVFKSGEKSAAMMNYHFFYEEMLFINGSKDTLALLNLGEVDCIYIKGDQYFYAKDRFVKMDTTVNDIKLANAGFFTTVAMKKLGAYGTATDGSMNQYVGFTAPNGRKVDLTPNTVTTYSFRKTLFIADKFNRFVPVNKKNIYNLYPEKQAQLKTYLQNNEVDFFSRKDIVALLVYMSK
ncbi:hypothetical protein ESA94_14350 [Lacibacter luteus]|uniref:Uncharacterized protein n=1 Tax=Lacibacter luteus TaxID=2508719 RepID=A0A4Q1CH74_9BACT|nr:hypothetical protein [Lacibacter luteus]RXK59317.1 hypothetical protein ESA94_14350 [Lacibacter luteus]